MRGCIWQAHPQHLCEHACKISGQKLKIFVGRIFERDLPSASVWAPLKDVRTRHAKTGGPKLTKFSGELAYRPIVPHVKRYQWITMYMHKIVICNVCPFSYNRGPTGGPIYLGNIGRVKDRCVFDTCENFWNDFFSSLFGHLFDVRKPCRTFSSCVSQRCEV